MAVVKRLYFSFFVLVYMLYALFNKGIAYSYLSEAIIVSGLLLVLWNLRSYEFAWDRRMALLFFFMFVIYSLLGLKRTSVFKTAPRSKSFCADIS